MSVNKRRARPAVVILIAALICVIITVVVFFVLGYRYISDKGIKFLGKVENGQPITGILNYPSGVKAKIDYIGKTITFDNGDLYTGDIEGVFRDGTGTMKYAVTNDTYSGTFVDDEMSGIGTYTYSNGDVYTGPLLDGKMNGIGKITFTSGATYNGNFNDGMRSGYGVYTWASGAKYDGAFSEDVKNGYGKMTYANGDYYEGLFVDDKRQGAGYYVWEDGESYRGNFANNLIDTRIIKSDGGFSTNADGTFIHSSEGVYTFATTGRTYTGYFEAGEVVAEDFDISDTQ